MACKSKFKADAPRIKAAPGLVVDASVGSGIPSATTLFDDSGRVQQCLPLGQLGGQIESGSVEVWWAALRIGQRQLPHCPLP